MANNEAQELAEEINRMSEAFDKLCQERHEAGKAEYGALTFLGNDVVRMMLEELADTANYCRMQFIKLMFLQQYLEESLDFDGVGNLNDQEGQDLQMGFEAFKGTKDVGWGKK